LAKIVAFSNTGILRYTCFIIFESGSKIETSVPVRQPLFVTSKLGCV